MKKKIIYGLLLAVSMVTASSSFVSCKDYEGDDYAHWQEMIANGTINQNSTLNDLIQFQLNTLKYELGNALGNGKDDAAIQALLNKVNGFTWDQTGSTYDLLQALNTLNGYTTQAIGLGVNESLANIRYAWGDSLKKAYDSAHIAYVLAKADSDSIANLKLAFAADTAALNQLLKSYKIDTAYLYSLDLDSKVDTLDFSQFKIKVGNDSMTIATRIDTLSQRADSLYGKAQALADSALRIAYDTIINYYIQDIYSKLKNETQSNDTLKDSIAAVKDSIEAVKDSLMNGLSTINVTLGELEDAYEKADSALAAKLDSLCKEVSDLKEAFDQLKKDVDDLKEQVEDIKKLIRQEITGIEIQGTYNNIFGYFALPVGIQSNVLAAYYGKFDAPVVFPVGDGDEATLWVGGIAKATKSELPTPKNGQFSQGAGLAFDESEGNAGTLYVTVNPSNVDFTGKTIDLRTSNNKLAPVTLGTLTPSEKLLMWGLTRANSANSFYEAKATISKDDVANTTLKFDMASVKSAVKDIINNWRNPSKINKTELANAVYKNLQQNVARLGVQATWEDAITGQQKSYVSKYDLAAVTAKPLGFDFLYGSDFSPYVTKVQDKITGKVHAIESDIKSLLVFNLGLEGLPTSIDLKVNPSKTVFTADVYAAGTLPKEVVITGLNDFINELKSAHPELSTDVDKQPHLIYTYKDGTTSQDELAEGKTFGDVQRMSVDISNVVINYEINTTPTVNVTNYNAGDKIATAQVDIKDLIDDMNNSIGSSTAGLNQMLTAVNGLQGKIDSKLAQISNMISSYSSQLLKYTDKVFGVAAALLKNPNRFLQPALFASNGDKVVNLSSEALLPTQVVTGGEIALFPTSFTGELVAPAFKKYIAVTKVTGGSLSQDKINALEGFNTVLDGNAYNQSKPLIIKADDSFKGATVEIIYEALGYNGKVAGRKYYITFK